ncbi:hypothetical protein BU25DRAFT_415190 [Macroventuria anomochaeta]|uniref:Uncharacterized protein n=1 Tax=Macroventuria anomochaeta TaxID=301207 RepID=A0ACB6RL68_9PLEO|nr:uncharacterized protein BU25DRAFT_415190 [Macroventuria anomochaeta]KAF2622457.1 hypothetical protein BU25DRAFT_415190 [Macroventuria anomochaeta]
MPGALRSRLRRVLTGQEGEGGIAGKMKRNKNTEPAEPESDFYKPGEKMPPMKYRRPVDPEHKKNLEAFTWKKAWRRRSHQSLYSPMGSRLPSRKGSFRSRRSRSRSVHRSRRSSFHSEYDEDDTWVDSGIGASISDSERPANIREASDDEGDVLNVGLSRNPTQDPRDTQRKESASGRRRSSSIQSVRRSSTRPGTGSDRTRQNSQPFSPEDLELALQKSHIEAKKLEAIEQSDPSGNGTPEDDDASPFNNLRPRGGSIFIPQDAESPGMFPGWNFVSSPTQGGPSYFPPKDGSPLQFERRESVFVSNEEPSMFQRRESVFVSNENTPQTGRRGSTYAPHEEDDAVPALTPAPPVEPSKRKPIPSCPSEEIMKILARKD